MSQPSSQLIAVAMPAEQWSVIDGSIDNTIAVDVVEGKDDVVAVGIAIREAGWAQVPWVDGQWPPLNQVITLNLSRAQWEFALTQLHRWQDLYGSWGDEDRPEVGDRAIEALRAHLT